MKKNWAKIFNRLIGKLITGQEDDVEFSNIYTALNDIEDRKLERDGTQNMTGNLLIDTAKANIGLKHDPSNIARVINDANGVNLTYNAFLDIDGNWKRDDPGKTAERFYITQDYTYRYYAAAGVNPITWIEAWHIKYNGLQPINVAQITDKTSTIQLPYNAWTKLLELPVSLKDNARVLVNGSAKFANTSTTKPGHMALYIFRSLAGQAPDFNNWLWCIDVYTQKPIVGSDNILRIPANISCVDVVSTGGDYKYYLYGINLQYGGAAAASHMILNVTYNII